MAQAAPSERLIDDCDGQSTLKQAVQALVQPEVQRPDAPAVVEALVKTEQEMKALRTKLPLESLLGSWRLCFTANKKSRLRSGIIEGRGQYIPGFIKAHLMFSPLPESSAPPESSVLAEPSDSEGIQDPPPGEDSTKVPDLPRLAIANQLQLGAFVLRLTGPAKYLKRKNLLAFDFTQMEIRLFGRRLYSGAFPGRRSEPESFDNQPIAKLPFFTFIVTTDQVLSARGRGGGLALWACDRELSHESSHVVSCVDQDE